MELKVISAKNLHIRWLTQSDPSPSTLRKPNCILAWCAFHGHHGQRLGRYLEGMAKVQPSSQPPGDFMNPLHQLLECSSTLRSGCLISHFGQFAHVLTHSFQVLEWTSVFETRAISGDSFHFISKSFIRAHTFAKNWALLEDLLNRQRIWTLRV